MSSTDEPEPQPIDTTDKKDAQVLLADPDDYHRTQRLREIHDARRNVHKLLRKTDGFTTTSAHKEQKARLSFAVTAYITELEPLFGATDADTSLGDNLPWEDLSMYATMMGSRPTEDGTNTEYAPYEWSLYVFRQANQFLSEVKPLLTEEKTKEWEV